MERSREGTLFEQIGTVQGAGNSSIVLNYVFYDEHPYPGLSYYRLRQVDFDGMITYSEIKSVYLGTFELISIYPNPAGEFIQFLLASESEGEVSIRIFDVLGKKVFEMKEYLNNGISARKISTESLSPGSYLLQVENNNQEKVQKEFVVK